MPPNQFFPGCSASAFFASSLSTRSEGHPLFGSDMRAMVAENRPRSVAMRVCTPALLLSLGLGLSSSGCIVLARESYTSLRGRDSVEVEPREHFQISAGRTGHALTHSPSLSRTSFGQNASVSAAVCDWDEGVWFVVFPPLPVPLLSLGSAAGRPGTTTVRLTFDGGGSWRAGLAALALVGADGVRATPERYQLVTTQLDTSLEPCAADLQPQGSVDDAELEFIGKAELWLRFPTLDWPLTPRSLELAGLALDGRQLPAARLAFEPGARWLWYRLFP
jgi:hypothetical protein